MTSLVASQDEKAMSHKFLLNVASTLKRISAQRISSAKVCSQRTSAPACTRRSRMTVLNERMLMKANPTALLVCIGYQESLPTISFCAKIIIVFPDLTSALRFPTIVITQIEAQSL